MENKVQILLRFDAGNILHAPKMSFLFEVYVIRFFYVIEIWINFDVFCFLDWAPDRDWREWSATI